jgi:hypothetical protein
LFHLVHRTAVDSFVEALGDAGGQLDELRLEMTGQR